MMFRLFLLLACAGLAACSYVSPRSAPRSSAIYTLDDIADVKPAGQPSCYSITVNTIRSAPGYGSSRMVYTRGDHQLQFFAYNKWADSPANMIHPLLVKALEKSGHFTAVLSPSAPEQAVLRLDTELVALRQRFDGSDSRIQLMLRVRVFAREQILATRLFNLEEEAGSGPESGVEAANRATARFTGELVTWVDELVAKAKPACP